MQKNTFATWSQMVQKTDVADADNWVNWISIGGNLSVGLQIFNVKS